jgi:hypothetical protein
MSDVQRPTKNRRINSRRRPKSFVRATCYRGSLDLGVNLAVALLDLSEAGARLLLRQPVEAKEEVTVLLESPHHRRPLRFTGQVTWSVATAEGNYCAGVHFDKRLPYVECFRLT